MANKCFIFVFIIETILKIILKKMRFFGKFRNLLDLLTLILSVVNLFYSPNYNLILNSFCKMLQIFKAYRLVKKFRSLRKVFNTIYYVFPRLSNILLLMILILYIYSIMAVNLFAYLKPQKNVDGFDVHFKDFFGSLFTLIRIGTSETWFLILNDCQRKNQPNFICNDILSYKNYKKYGYNYLLFK